MKKNFFTFGIIIMMMVMAMAVQGCDDDPELPQVRQEANSDLLLSRSGDAFANNWENYQTWNLRDGSAISLPWNNVAVKTAVRRDFRDDVKKSDGWELLFHSLSGGDVTTPDVPHYIVLYNHLSSQLKIFLDYDGGLPTATDCYWRVSVESESYSGLLNDMSDINLPAYMDDTNQAIVTNISNNEGRFTNGWQMVLFNMAYNPSSSGPCMLNITSGAENNFKIDLDALYNSNSEGTITSYTQRNGAAKLVNKMSTSLGESAEDWIKKKFGLGDSKGVIGDVLSGVLKKGINKVFKSFIARQNVTESTVQDLQFTTHTAGTISGTLSAATTSSPIVGSFTLPEAKAKMLGNWSLRETPTIYIHPVGIMIAAQPGYPTQCTYGFTASGNYKYDIVVNPELKKYVKSQRVELTPVNYIGSTLKLIPGNTTTVADRGSMTANDRAGISLPLSEFRKQIVNVIDNEGNRLVVGEDMMRASMTYYGIENPSSETKSQWPYSKYVFAPDHKIYQRGDFKYYKDDYRLKVTVTMTANFGGEDVTCITTRTYIPKIELDPTLVKWYKGYDLEGLYNEAERDKRLDALRGFVYPVQGGLLSGYSAEKQNSDESETE